MQFDRNDVEKSARIGEFVGEKSRLTVKHTPTGVSHELETEADRNNLPWDRAFAELREKIVSTIAAGQPDKLVRITKQGVGYRIPWAKPGWLFVVGSETPSPDGTYVNVHVKDSAGNTWTLSKGDYEPFEQV